jgi:hypothetical protein
VVAAMFGCSTYVMPNLVDSGASAMIASRTDSEDSVLNSDSKIENKNRGMQAMNGTCWK